MNTLQPDLTQAITGLLEKYAVAAPAGWTLIQGVPTPGSDGFAAAPYLLLASSDENVVPLFPWRKQRRFVELRQMVANGTIQRVKMARFSSLSDGLPLTLPALLYREFDLLEWITGQRVVRLNASGAPRAMNVVARLADGSIASIEVGTTLSSGSPVEDRHELISGRGVGCDRVVDTQVRQESVYVWSENGKATYTDVDNELYGLDMEQAAAVRAAYDFMRLGESASEASQQHAHLATLVDAAIESDRSHQCVVLKGACAG